MSCAKCEGIPKPPPSPPDCPFRSVKDSKVPDNAFYVDGILNKEKVYIGRVCHNRNFYIGTAIPSKGVCLFVADGTVHESDTYQVITMDCGNPLEFHAVTADHDQEECYKCDRLKFLSGTIGEDDLLYTGRYKSDDGNTYYGWVKDETNTLHIPREGSTEVVGEYEILIHNLLDRLCICPCPPTFHRCVAEED